MIAIIGLGYVGLPLAVEFAKAKYSVVGFDIAEWRIKELQNKIDRTLETSSEDLEQALNNKIKFTTDINDLKKSNIYIVTVPTPIDKFNKPDLTPLLKATETVAKVLSKGDIVIYESTVYPGATEEECVPILEKISNLKFNQDFFCGYSPERINPGDKKHTLTKILKVTSGSTPEIAKKIDDLYKSIIKAGTYLAPSIKVAEAAKVIENSQRDINIAFVNELAKIFAKMDIDTTEVLKAAGTKWNFLNFSAGLVGGHCIGIDPYYLAYKAESVGYTPDVILAGRKINDSMGEFVANRVLNLLKSKNIELQKSKILVLGITFKENIPDIRNSRVIDIIQVLQKSNCLVDVYDPWADHDEVKREYSITLIDKPTYSNYDGVILAVPHREFKNLKLTNKVIFDVKSLLDKNMISERL